MTKPSREWVALMTFSNQEHTTFWEAGGIYREKPQCSWRAAARELDPTEPVVTCPRCGQRFAATDEFPPEMHRDLHFEGDEEIPSICIH